VTAATIASTLIASFLGSFVEVVQAFTIVLFGCFSSLAQACFAPRVWRREKMMVADIDLRHSFSRNSRDEFTGHLEASE
jgi:hypothetical protein